MKPTQALGFVSALGGLALVVQQAADVAEYRLLPGPVGWTLLILCAALLSWRGLPNPLRRPTPLRLYGAVSLGLVYAGMAWNLLLWINLSRTNLLMLAGTHGVSAAVLLAFSLQFWREPKRETDSADLQ